MRAVAHGWKPRKGSVSKIPRKVAREYVRADQRKARKRRR